MAHSQQISQHSTNCGIRLLLNGMLQLRGRPLRTVHTDLATAFPYTVHSLHAFSHSIPIHCSTYPYTFILLLVRLMPMFLRLQPQHSHTLQYIPLYLHFAVGKAYAYVPTPSATAFPYTAVHTSMPPFRCW